MRNEQRTESREQRRWQGTKRRLRTTALHFSFIIGGREARWTMLSIAYDTDTPLYFQVRVFTSLGTRYEKKADTIITVKDQNISSIVISLVIP